MNLIVPPEDTPTVDLVVGGRYFTSFRDTVYTVIARRDDGRFDVRNEDNGSIRAHEANGRRWNNTTTFSDLVGEA